MQTPAGIEKDIYRAKTRFALYGQEISADEYFQKLIAEYRQAIQNTQQLMRELSLVALCSNCAAEEHGSCCAEEVENWYDDWLFFINLLMGATVDNVREAQGHCLFVGANGCKLVARHSFCVNFLCPEIVRALEASEKQKLLAISGKELFAGWTLEQQLRKWFSNNSKNIIL